MALVGNEILMVQGIDGAGRPAATEFPTTTGAVAALAGANPNAPIAAGATKTLTTANAGSTTLLNTAAGSVVTLPVPTGSGAVYRFVVSVSVTSASHKILAASSSDNFQGVIFTQKTGTCSGWGSLVSDTNHSLQMPAAASNPQGGLQGDWYEFRDIASHVWEVSGGSTSGGTVATPFSTATT